ncbi:TetR/AcrR family transcriptional regulator [Streptomyces rubradiris]|uniref:TetR family transcriptional regulator n=1 Tax=Streptomyces rubradiris TaxID=285531 RepID=A0ABQ3RIE7_STRRR|nr:TetR/AcrR family transcriptional regulator [Streptomyces rubradiris]GHH21731.1 TetR family transcriptional regulator [Streptomyces rubradiris]GHI55634.1 TetR family transcriptional regulator [Streptomyces rubradiris]
MANSIRETGARSRTRRAILSAAASVLSRRRDATLADIAAAADVGRSTLQRYFPDREELISAVVEHSLRRLDESLEGARTDEGPPLEALRRLVAAMLDAGDHVLFLYGDPRITDALAARGGPDPAAEEIRRLIRRGQEEGVVDPDVSSDWIEHVLWAHVSAGCTAVSRGKVPRHGASAWVIRTLENGIGTRTTN